MQVKNSLNRWQPLYVEQPLNSLTMFSQWLNLPNSSASTFGFWFSNKFSWYLGMEMQSLDFPEYTASTTSTSPLLPECL